MVAKNEHTGDSIRSKVLSKQGEENWERIFGNKNKPEDRLEVLCNICGKDKSKVTECGWTSCPKNFEET